MKPRPPDGERPRLLHEYFERQVLLQPDRPAIECDDEVLTYSQLDRIAAREDEVQAWVHLDPGHSLAQAREADRQRASGAGSRGNRRRRAHAKSVCVWPPVNSGRYREGSNDMP